MKLGKPNPMATDTDKIHARNIVTILLDMSTKTNATANSHQFIAMRILWLVKTQ